MGELGGLTNRYQIVAEFYTKNAEGYNTSLKRVEERMGKFNGHLAKFQKTTNYDIVANKKFEKSIKETTKRIDNMNKSLKKNSVAMLGVMFGAMNLNRILTSLVQPVMDAYGVFDLWNAVLLTTFIPIMDTLLPIFLWFTDFFLNIPVPMQWAIGLVTLLGIAVTSITVAFISWKLAMVGLGSEAAATGAILSGIFLTAGLIAGLILVMGWLVSIKDELGSWPNFFISVAKGIVNVLGLIGYAITTVLLGPIMIFVGVIKNILDWVNGHIPDWAKISSAPLQGIINGLNAAIDSPLNGAQALNDYLSGFQTQATDTGTVAKQFSQTTTNAFTNVGSGAYQMSNQVTTATDGMCSAFTSSNELILSDTQSMVDSLNSKYASIKYPNSYGGMSIASGSSGSGSSGQTGNGWYNGVQYQTQNSNGTWTGINHVNDFIWRPGESPTQMSKDDTVVGFKGDSPFGGGNITLNVTNNITVSDRKEIDRAIEINNRRLVDDLRRMVKA